MQRNYPLRNLNTWGVGGLCTIYDSPVTSEEACISVAAALKQDLGIYILGGGSNVLVSDDPIRSAVLHTQKLDFIKLISSGIDGGHVEIEAGAGVPVKKLLALAIDKEWTGLEFLTGIPGTLGGALWGNAGANGCGFGGLVKEISAIDWNARAVRFGEETLNWEYRACPLDEGKTALVTSCVISLRKASRKSIFKSIKNFAAMKKGQPLGRKTAGCVFKNPPGMSAGYLLDECGCKGMRIGGAVVSDSHANFIENERDALSRDIYKLCELCREKVLELRGVHLEYEIKFLGDFKKD
ncbi:MAG: UDP-N-acetylmuramate dehydrogenase [Synergistaceae bacterium]|nr:UDP-N-acetylmuramate dehydrogenase [Synergistaceae bacterium]